MEGEVVGMNLLVPGLAQMGGLAVPAEVVADVSKRLAAEGEVKRSWWGLKFEALRDFGHDRLGEAGGGVLVLEVEEGSPAASAEVEPGDILLAVNDQPLNGTYVEQLPEVYRRLAYLPPDEPVSLRVQREGELLELDVTPAREGLRAASRQ
jgi:S1-C subfamily serine protease